MRPFLHRVVDGFALPVAFAVALAVPQTAAGTGAISGTVVEETSHAPIRHAGVWFGQQQINTDDSGRFRITGLSAGRYPCTVYASGFVHMECGADKPGGQGLALVLADGEQWTGVVVRMTRGAVITGRLVDQRGEPVTQVAVWPQRWVISPRTGERRMVPSGGSGAQTDDRGVYRLVELPPGEYTVMTTVASLWVGISTGPGLDQLPMPTRGEVDAARRGIAPVSRSASSRPVRMLKTPTYYPGTIRAVDALPITVAAGEERSGIDFAVQYQPAFSVSGHVALPGGVTPLRIVVQAFSKTTGGGTRMPGMVDEDGSFILRDVAPGDYIVGVQAFLPPAEASERWSSTVPLAVIDRDVTSFDVTPSRGITVSGQVQFEGDAPTAEQLKSVRLGLKAIVEPGEINFGGPPASIDTRGAFSIAGVTPGRYSLELTPAQGPGRPAGWLLKSASIGGREAADGSVDIATADIPDAAVVVSRRPAGISGTLLDSRGQPVPGGAVVIFAANRALWASRPRRVVLTWPSSRDGSFASGPMPAGEYVVAAAVDLGPDEELTPAVLELLSVGALRVTLHDGEQATRDLRAPSRMDGSPGRAR